MTTREIRADVPIDLHPDTLAPFAAALDRDGLGGRGAFAAAQEALADLYDFYAATQHAEKELRRLAPTARRRQRPDGTSEYLGDLRMTGGSLRSFHGHEEEFAAVAQTAFDRAAKVADRRLKELQQHHDAVTKRIADAVDYPAGRLPLGVSQGVEIRAHVRALPSDERAKLLNSALASGDHQTIAAVLSAPGYLAGLETSSFELLRDRAAKRFAPEDSAALNSLDALMQRVRNAGALAVARLLSAQKAKDTPGAQSRRVLHNLSETLG